jgi:WD40 repeat protein
MTRRKDTQPRYDVFISYSQHLDREVASAFQQGMENFGRPWYRPVQLRVFRDMTHLSASRNLRNDIERALARSHWLIVMASPRAAASPWVRAEIDWWVADNRGERMLFAWTDGALEWSQAEDNFDWSQTDALPREQMERALAATPGCPRWVDLRWLRAQIDEQGSVPVDDPRLVAAVAEFIAPIRGRSKSELIGHHLLLRRRRNWLVAATVCVLCVLLAAATVLGLVADRQRAVATERQRVAASRQLVAEAASIQDTRPDLARQLLVQAYRLSHTEQVMGALLSSASLPRLVHTDGIARAVAVSPRGRLMAVASGDGTALYDVATGKKVSTLTGQRERDSTRAVAFHADGRLLAEGDLTGRLRLWDLKNTARPRMLGSAHLGDGIDDLAFAEPTPLLVAGTGAQVVVLDITDQRRPTTAGAAPVAGPMFGVGIDVSPDGELIAARVEDNRVGITRLSPSGKPSLVSTLATPAGAVAFSPGGHLLATAGEDSVIRLWDIVDPRRPKLRTVLSGQSGGINLLAFAPDGKTLATAVMDATIQLWDLSDPLRPRHGTRLTGHTAPYIDSLTFAPDGHTLVSAASGDPRPTVAGEERAVDAVRLWNVRGPHSSTAYGSLPPGYLSPQAFDPKGQILVAGRPSMLWRVGGVLQPQPLATLPTFNRGGQRVSFSPDGNTLVTGHPLRFWDASNPSRPRELDGSRMVEDAGTVVYAPDGSILADAEPAGALRLWEVSDPRNPRPLAALPGSGAGHSAYAAGVPIAFAGARPLLATLREDSRAVHLWDISRPDRPVRTGVIPVRKALASSLTSSPDGLTLFLGDSAGTVTTWDIAEPHRVRRLGASQRLSGEVTHLAVHPTRDLLAGVDEHGAVRLWDVSDPSALRETALLVAGGSGQATGLAFSPDGGLLALSTYTGTLLWQANADAILQRLCAESTPLTETEWKQYLPDRPYDPPCA